MKKLMLFEYFRNTVKNTFIAFLLAALCLMMTALLSIISYEYGKYKPIANMKINRGIYMPSIPYDPIENTTMDPEEIEGVDKVYKTYRSIVFIDNKVTDVFVYDGWLWEGWSGRLRSGHWFRGLSDGPELEVIVGGDNRTAEVGQIYTVTAGIKKIRLKVIGVLQPKTEIFYKESSYDAELDSSYRGMYNQPDPYEPKMYFIVQRERADEIGLSYAGLNYVFAGYADNLSDEEAEALTAKIKTAGYGIGFDFTEYKEKSKLQMLRKVMTYVPTIAVAFIITLLALYCIAYINIMDGSRYYSIYYLIGAGKKRCFVIASAYAVITIAVSAVLYTTGGFVLENIAKHKNVMYSFRGTPKLPAIILYTIFVLFLELCIFRLMKKRSALDMIRLQKR